MMNREKIFSNKQRYEKHSDIKPKRGQIWLIKFKKVEDNKSIRSCVVISNNTQNEFDERIVVVGTTTKGLEKLNLLKFLLIILLKRAWINPEKFCLVIRELSAKNA